MKLSPSFCRHVHQALEENNYASYGYLIQFCTDHRLPFPAKQLHARIIISQTMADNYLASKLIALYSKTNQMSDAHHVFDKILHKNTFACNALLIAYAAHKRHDDVLKMFASWLSGRDDGRNLVDVKPDTYTLSCVLKSMSEVALTHPLLPGMIHCYAMKNGLDLDVFVGNGLVTYYSRNDDLVSARALFSEMPNKDLVSWNSMLSGYSQGGHYEECKDLYRSMLSLEGLKPDGITAVNVLHACAESTDLIFGMEVHKYLIDNGIELDLSVLNSIIAVYANCGSLDFACQLFEEMTEKDEITYSTIVSGYMLHGFVDKAMRIFREMKNPGMSTWNAVISGRVQNNQYDKVLDLVRDMQVRGSRPDCVTLSSILPAIPHVSHLKGAKEIHAYAIKFKSDKNIYVVTAMIDAYAKLGFLSGSQRIFNLFKDRSVILWTAIISAHATHGDANIALSLFYEMLNSRTKPDAVAFTAVLAACAHGGLVDKAWEIFHIELPNYGVQPLPNHYACVVTCLCRAGKLGEAVEFIRKMPTKPSAQVWGAVLTGASECGDVELAEYVCDHLFEMEPENPSNYIVMANLYSGAGKWKEAESVREKLRSSGFSKVAGSSRV